MRFNKIKNETFNIGGGIKNSISLEKLTRICENLTKTKIKLGKIKIEIFKNYRLDEVVQAHKDLESRKIIGSAVIIP